MGVVIIYQQNLLLKEEKKELKTINLLNDALFKTLLRSIEARPLISTILSIVTDLPTELFLNAKYVGGENPKQIITEKGKTSDVIILLRNEDKIIVEMNQYFTPNIFKKNTSYAFSNFLEGTRMGENIWPQIIIINIDNFNHFHTMKEVLKFELRSEDGYIESNVYTSIHLILENMLNPEYNKNTELRKFAQFLRANNIQKLKNIAKGDEKYMAAIRRVEELSKDPEFIGYYDYAEAVERDKREMKRYGIEQGIKQGIEQNTQSMIQTMYQKEVPILEISRITEIPIEKITKILEDSHLLKVKE